MNIFCVDHLPREIPVGYQTEHGVERVGFDVATWVRKWPGMQVQIWASVPGTDTSYPAKNTREGSILYWDVSLADTAVAGRGAVEIVGLADGIKKIARAETIVRASATAEPGEVPDPQKPWVDAVLDAAYRAEEAAKRAEAAEGGGVDFETDETLTLSPDGILSVNTANDVEQDNTLPVTSAAVKKAIDSIDISGGVDFEVDETLTLANGILSVNTTDAATEDDARPITSQGVYNEFAVINALLKTI